MYLYILIPWCVCRLGHLLHGPGQRHGASSGAGLVVTGAAASAHEPHEAPSVHLHPRLHRRQPGEPR